MPSLRKEPICGSPAFNLHVARGRRIASAQVSSKQRARCDPLMKPNHADSKDVMVGSRLAVLGSVGQTEAFLSNGNPGSGVDGRSREGSDLTGPRRTTQCWPDHLVVQRVDRILARHYRLQLVDRQDVIAESLLECLRARGLVRTSINGFFVVVARRRACDFWRRKCREERVAAKAPAFISGNEDEVILIGEVVERFFAGKSPLARCRAQCIVREILDGSTFSEACRAARVPRGSQGRYRTLLRECFRDVLHRDRNMAASSPTSKSA